MSLSTRTKVKPPSTVTASYSVNANVVVAKLSWTPIASGWPNSYQVLYRDGEEYATSLTATTYRDTNVVAGQGYNYGVSTVNVNEVEGEPKLAAGLVMPNYPVWQTGWSLDIQQASTASVASRASSPDGRSITYTRQGGTAPAAVTVSTAGVVSVGAAAAGSYTLILRADDGVLYAEMTVTLTVTAAATAPNPPVVADPQVVSTTQINLSWTKAATGTDPEDYDARYSLAGQNNWTNLTPLTGPSALSFNVTGLAAGTAYDFGVRASAGGLFSSYTVVSATTLSSGTREVYYTAMYDQPQYGGGSALVNGGLFHSLYHPDVIDSFNNAAQSGTLTASNLDQRIVASDTFDGVTVTPPFGSRFLKQVLWYDSEYECLNGTVDDGVAPPVPAGSKDKPRIKYSLGNSAYNYDWDREVWVGFALYTHPNHVHDIATRAHQGGGYHFWVNAGNGLTQFYLTTFARPTTNPGNYTGGLGGNTEYWFLGYQVNATAVADMVQQAGSPRTFYNAMTSRDSGWTQWMLRYRVNPFAGSGTINPSLTITGAKNKTYTGNKGIMQVWHKKEGASSWTKAVDIFNAPFGGVPSATELLGMDFGKYDYGWKKNATTFPNWRYTAKNSIRWGFRKAPGSTASSGAIAQFGTGPADVSPDGTAPTDWAEQA
ncbi:fibronectin type III domain-containing protein [Nitrospira sp. BLG_2]|uniref:fibronectin type III domain-containing protein n=1 Tax=Nitrospira sp. BLG_2 TaxID=3397507 RepID=UPI003B9A4D93